MLMVGVAIVRLVAIVVSVVIAVLRLRGRVSGFGVPSGLLFRGLGCRASCSGFRVQGLGILRGDCSSHHLSS